MINNEKEVNNEKTDKKEEEEDETKGFSSDLSLKQSASSSQLPSNSLEPVQESCVLNDGETKAFKKPISPRQSTVNVRHGRNRTDSIRHLTDRVKSFSNDFFRSIENAHEMIDLKHSNFSAATQTAAAHAALCHQNPLYDYNSIYPPVQNKENFTRSITEIKETSSCEDELGEKLTDGSKTSFKSNKVYDSNTDTESTQSPKFFRPLDEINITDVEKGKRVIFENNNQNISNDQNNKNQEADQIDFSIRKRYVFKNGSKKSIPDDIHISILEVFIYLWGVITFFADLISDIVLSLDYFRSSRIWLAIMTLMFVIVPNFTLSLFSLSWYIDKYVSEKKLQEEKRKQNCDLKDSHLPNTTCQSITFWIMTILFVVFQLDLVWKYIQGFIYTLKGWACRSIFHNLKWEKYYIEKQIKCDTDIGMLRLIDVFLDSGPQVLLQLYVITTQNLNELGSANIVVFTFKDLQTTSIEIKQLFSILSSLLSMGYALAGYHRCLRNQQFIFCLETNKPLPRPMRWISTIMQFIWYLFLIAPRVLSMAIFASTFRSWFFMIIFTHWIIMYFWILRLKTNYCISNDEIYSAREEIFEKFYDFVCSFIYVFVYFNLKAGPTRYRYLIYYIIFYSENILFCTCYFFFSKEQNFAYKLTLLLIVVFGFWIAITFQIIYYLHCHPSHKIRVCVRKSDKFYFIHKEMLKPADFYDLSESDSENADNKTNLHKSHETCHHKKPLPKIANSNEKQVDSGKTSSSSSSITNDNENSASTLKLIKVLPNGEILVESNVVKRKEKKKFFKNNFTKFLNLYSSSDTAFVNQNDNNKNNSHEQIETKRNDYNDVLNEIQTSNITDKISSPNTINGSLETFSSFSYSKESLNESSFDSFKSAKSAFKIDQEPRFLAKKKLENSYKSLDFSIDRLNPPLVDLNEILDSQELYDNMPNNINKKRIIIVRSKSSCSLKKNKEAFL